MANPSDQANLSAPPFRFVTSAEFKALRPDEQTTYLARLKFALARHPVLAGLTPDDRHAYIERAIAGLREENEAVSSPRNGDEARDLRRQ